MPRIQHFDARMFQEIAMNTRMRQRRFTHRIWLVSFATLIAGMGAAGCACPPCQSGTKTEPQGEASRATPPIVTVHRGVSAPTANYVAEEVANIGTIYVSPDVIVDDADFKSAKAVETDRGTYAVEIELTPAGAEKMARFTRANLGNYAVIRVDGKVETAPKIMSEVRGRIMISGNFTAEEAEQLASKLNR
jgi:preprotein translocase subunit SecD